MSALEDRLASQLAGRGMKNAKDEAKRLLKERGQMDGDGKLTQLGKERNRLGASGRAKDRAAKASGGAHTADDYSYNRHTNAARLK